MATASRVLAVWAGLAGLLVGGEASACSLTVTNIGSTAWTGGFGRGYDVYDSQRRTQLIGFRVRTLDVLHVLPDDRASDDTRRRQR